MDLPQDLWILQIMSGINMDDWIKYINTNPTFKAMAETPSVMKRVLILTKDKYVFNKQLAHGALKGHYSFMKLAQAGNLGARVRIISGYRFSATFLEENYPNILNLITDWLRDPNIIPYLYYKLSTPYSYSENLLQLYNLAPLSAQQVFDRKVRLGLRPYKPVKLTRLSAA